MRLMVILKGSAVNCCLIILLDIYKLNQSQSAQTSYFDQDLERQIDAIVFRMPDGSPKILFKSSPLWERR